mgnify:CR=1 FL=1
MILDSELQTAKKYFPNTQLLFKNESALMKLLAVLLFFNKDFSTKFITAIGSKIYFPSQQRLAELHPIDAKSIFIHELIHIYDSSKLFKIFFSLSYLSPQIFTLLALPFLLISWKLSLLCLIFLLPIPSYFRMYFELRAYKVSLYALHHLSNKFGYTTNLHQAKEYYTKQFTSSAYYFMFPFKSYIEKEFDDAIKRISLGAKPFDDKVFEMVDEIINNSTMA